MRCRRDLKKRGMSFVGSTILYAFMQAVGMVDDHLVGCFRAANSGGKRKPLAG
jgi:DNA-3-methyladenine glycosylase I